MDADIKYLKTVYVVMDIYTGQGKRYPCTLCYLDFLEPGPFTDWQELNSIGMSL
jgi:hypothetical protein